MKLKEANLNTNEFIDLIKIYFKYHCNNNLSLIIKCVKIVKYLSKKIIKKF